MGADSKIEWTDHTFNPWVGCTKVSPGCDGCYAEEWALRAGRDVWGPGVPRERTTPNNWRQPLKWDAEAARDGVKRFVFVASLADVFDNEVDHEWRRDLFRLIDQTPNLIWLVLTKRVGNVVRMMEDMRVDIWPWPGNAWLGVTIVNQDEAHRDLFKAGNAKRYLRIPRLFVSVEPMLGPVDLTRVEGLGEETGRTDWGGPLPTWSALDFIDWVICGGESGRNARPMHPQWPRQLEYQCQNAGVPFLFKQWGEWTPVSWKQEPMFAFEDGTRVYRQGKKAAGRWLDGAIHNGRPQP